MPDTNRKSPLSLPLALTVLAAVLAGGATALALLAPPALAQGAAASRLPPEVWTWGLLSAALATGCPALAAATRWPSSARPPWARWPRSLTCSAAC